MELVVADAIEKAIDEVDDDERGASGNGQSALGALLSGLMYPSQGSLTLNGNGSFTYTPDSYYVGPDDSFTYHANDGTDDSNSVTVTITVTEVAANTPPVTPPATTTPTAVQNHHFL